MGAPRPITRRRPGSRKSLGAALLLACVLALVAAPSALGALAMNVREVYPGSVAQPAAEFVELQAPSGGVDNLQGQRVTFYGPGGGLARSVLITGEVANDGYQRTVLLATSQAVATIPSFPEPDFTLGSQATLSAGAGAVCFPDITIPDCVTWGAFTPTVPAQFPDPQASNAAAITDGMSITRDISRGCATELDFPDDTDKGAIDFSVTTPTPRSSATVPTETACPTVPDTSIGQHPPTTTKDTSASFTYSPLPPQEATYECRLDSASFSSCPSSGIQYTALSEGSHTFRVRAINGVGPDPSPAALTWTVDTTSPDTTIDSVPSEPSSPNPTFTYHASEVATFLCSLDGGPVESCPDFGKSYVGLSGGLHVFSVWATDPAGNVDSSPTSHTFTVDTAIGDITPPDTLILAGPSDPSPSPTAPFTYASNEAGASFQCRIGTGPFLPCLAEGISYQALRNAPYAFEVRAVDRAGNVDPVPALHTWRLAAPLPDTQITKSPPGLIRLPKGGGAMSKRQKLAFAFTSSKPGSSFRCRVDNEPFAPCGSAVTVKAGPGRHRFEVYAIDTLGNVEAIPARWIFILTRGDAGGYARSGKLLASFTSELKPQRLPRDHVVPVRVAFEGTFENLDATDTPALRTMVVRLSRGGKIVSQGLPRCPVKRLKGLSSAEALSVCGDAQVGSGMVNSALRFPDGRRVRSRSKLLLFNTGGGILMHLYTTDPLKGTFLVPMTIHRGAGAFGTVLKARFPKIASGYGYLTGFEMEIDRTFRFRGKRQSYVVASCPAPQGFGRVAFELARVTYDFRDGVTLRNSTLRTCTVRDS